MGHGLLTADAAEGDNPPQPKQIPAVMLFQDQNYTILRNKEKIDQEDVLNLPLHLILIGMGMLDARNYVPKVGKEGFLKTLLKLKKQFNRNYKNQVALAQTVGVKK